MGPRFTINPYPEPEGLNGRLPNQDLYNSFRIIAQHTGGVPVILYDHLDPRETEDKSYPPSWIPSVVKSSRALMEFSIRGRNIARHMYYQASGKGSGVHALYHKYVYKIKYLSMLTVLVGIASMHLQYSLSLLKVRTDSIH